MSKINKSVCRFCRRENMKLFLKGERCFTDKCAFERRAYPPGQHGRSRLKFSDYALQLREKQKLRRYYGVNEKQFRNYFFAADRAKGVTGLNLLRLLEKRLDNVIYVLGFAASRREAKQLISHGHFAVNGKKLDISSYQLQIGDTIEILATSKENKKIAYAIETSAHRDKPSWLHYDTSVLMGTVKALPERHEILPIEENIIVEFYSR